MATSFHPEVGGDTRIHHLFLEHAGVTSGATDRATSSPTD
jgi:hypothetical protein